MIKTNSHPETRVGYMSKYVVETPAGDIPFESLEEALQFGYEYGRGQRFTVKVGGERVSHGTDSVCISGDPAPHPCN